MIVRRKKKNYRKWLLICLLVIAVIGSGAAYFIAHNLSGSAQGTASSVALNESDGQPSFDPTPVKVKGALVSFSYPKSFLTDKPNATDSVDLASYRYKYFAGSTWQLAISVERLPSPSLKNDSGYVYRTLHPEKYIASTKTIGGQIYTIMTDTSQPNFTQVAYTPFHGNLLGIIALTGYESGSNDKLNLTFDMVMASWRWQ